MTLSIFVRDDLVQLGLTIDGEATIARRFYVVAEAPDGRRLAHDFSLIDHVEVSCPNEGKYWVPDEGGAEDRIHALRDRIVTHVAAGGALNEDHWDEIDPCYGSPAYQSLDATGHFRQRERLVEGHR